MKMKNLNPIKNMKVICKQTSSQGFDLTEVTTVLTNDFDYSFGGYGLEKGKEYLVMGIVTYQDSGCLYYLIDVNGKPEWFPDLLFNISDNSFPKDWYVKVNNKNPNTDIQFMCGFNELCNEEHFYDQLSDRNRTALEIYFKRKIQFENDFENFC